MTPTRPCTHPTDTDCFIPDAGRVTASLTTMDAAPRSDCTCTTETLQRQADAAYENMKADLARGVRS